MIACGLFIGIVLIAMRVDMYNSSFDAIHGTVEGPVFMRLLGEGKSIVSNLSILQADRYFHGGIGHIPEGDGEGALMNGCRVPVEGLEKGGREFSRWNILFRLSGELELTQHIHLEGDQVKEIIPWLYYSIKIDPHNVMAYTLAAYYLSARFDRTRQALVLLREGLANNPDSWEINAEIGRLYLEHYKDYKNAATYLTRAYDLMQDVPHDKFQERYVLTFLAHSYELLGENDAAVMPRERIHELFPEYTVVRDGQGK